MAAKKVLVVEDDRTLLDVPKWQLDSRTYEVETATEGPLAMELASLILPRLRYSFICLMGASALERTFLVQ